MAKAAKPTLCWDCAKATGGCRWSDQLQPIPGWDAELTKSNTTYSSYIVNECPEFVRDGINVGTKRYNSDDPLSKAVKGGMKAIYGSNNK